MFDHQNQLPEPAQRDRVLRTLISRHQARHATLREAGSSGAYHEELTGVVLFVDITGFTAMTEAFTQEGRDGSERLALVVRGTFSSIVNAITSLSGDVIAFAGDAIWATFTCADAFPDETALKNLSLCATRAALTISDSFLDSSSNTESRVRVRIALGIGSINLSSIVVSDTETEFLAYGSALDDASTVGKVAHPGKVRISAGLKTLLAQSVSGTCHQDETFEVSALTADLLPQAGQGEENAFTAFAQARRYLQGFLLRHIDQQLVAWTSEFRTVSVLFIKLSHLDLFSASAQRSLTEAISNIHNIANRYGGERYQLLMDEKGLTYILAFGLPLAAHEDDAARAVRTALDVQQGLTQKQVGVAIGCATGTVFCNITGDENRRAYVMTGSTLNIAARLMQEETTGILCDHQTRAAAQNQAMLAFEALPPRTVAGRSDAVLVYRPGYRTRTLAPKASVISNRRLLGRHQERLFLSSAITEFNSSGKSRVVVIDGEAGIGKSTLLDHAAETLREHGIQFLSGAGQSLETAANYHALSSAFRALLKTPVQVTDETSLNQHLKRVVRDPMLHPFLSLLNHHLPFPLEGNEATAALTDEGRADRLRDLLLACLEYFCRQERRALLIEDGHWLDDASFTWLLRAARLIPNLILFVTSRPEATRDNGTLAPLFRLPNCQRLTLAPMTDEEVCALLCDRLNLTTVAAQVQRLVLLRASGNPFFSVEVLFALRDQGLLSLEDAHCAPQSKDLESDFDAALAKRGLPTGLQGIITSRLDGVSLHGQLVLKIASVIGQPFSPDLIKSLAPVELPREALPHVLATLVSADFLRPIDGAQEPQYAIGHALVRDAIYDSIPFAQRRSLHLDVAFWLEAQPPSLRSHALLAYHYDCGGKHEAALKCYEAAGMDAQRLHSYNDAARCFTKAIALFDDQYQGTLRRPEAALRGNLELSLGSALVSWSKHREAIVHLKKGLAFRDEQLPQSTLWLILRLLFELLFQVATRFRRSQPAPSTEERVHWIEVSRAYEGLTESFFNHGQNLECVYCALVSLNRAERAGASAELARGYSSFGAILGFIPAESIARSYCTRAQAVAVEVQDYAAQAWVSIASAVFEAGLGNFTIAESYRTETTRLGNLIGDMRRLNDSSENQIAICFLRGRLMDGVRAAEELLRSARLRDDLTMQGSALKSLTYGRLWTGHLELAKSSFAELKALRQDALAQRSALPTIDAGALGALIEYRNGNYSEAYHAAKVGVCALIKDAPMFYATVFEYFTLAEVLLELANHSFLDSDALAKQAMRQLNSFARVFPIARPAKLLCMGLAKRLSGKQSAAHRCFEDAISFANTLGMPYFEALGHYQLTRGLSHSASGIARHRSRAVELLEEMDETFYRERAIRVSEAMSSSD